MGKNNVNKCIECSLLKDVKNLIDEYQIKLDDAIEDWNEYFFGTPDGEDIRYYRKAIEALTEIIKNYTK